MKLDEPTDTGVPEMVMAGAPTVRVVPAMDMPPSERNWAFSP